MHLNSASHNSYGHVCDTAVFSLGSIHYKVLTEINNSIMGLPSLFCLGVCEDGNNYCSQWPDSYCQTYEEYMKINCPRKCGYCSKYTQTSEIPTGLANQ